LNISNFSYNVLFAINELQSAVDIKDTLPLKS